MDSVFTIMPMSQKINLAAGETYEGYVTVVNPIDAKEDFNYKVSILPYGVSGEEYTADLVTEGERTMIMDWITINEPTGTLRPNESKKVKFTIKVPETAPAGGQYAAITVSSSEMGGGSDRVAVNNIFEMASLIYANVSGDVIRSGEVLSNDIPGFIVSPPATASALISNTGNTHNEATISLNVKNAITGEVILPTDEESGYYAEMVMPDSTRLITREISGLPALGVVHVNQTIYYNGQISAVDKNIIICPIWFMLVVALVLGAIAATVVRIILKHKHKKVAI